MFFNYDADVLKGEHTLKHEASLLFSIHNVNVNQHISQPTKKTRETETLAYLTEFSDYREDKTPSESLTSVCEILYPPFRK